MLTRPRPCALWMAITRATKCKEVERECETQAVSVKAHTGLRFFVGGFSWRAGVLPAVPSPWDTWGE